MDRAYALLTVKGFDPEQRTFTGIATTPTPDRSGDIVDPLGVSFRNPLPLLLHHDKTAPVGRVIFHQPTADGVTFEATIPEVAEAGIVRDRVNEAWDSIKAGLLTGVSIGFRVLRDGAERLKSGAGFLLKRIEVCELSLVTVPSNQDATILTIKSLDVEQRAASRPNLSGASDIRVVRLQKGSPAMNKNTITEQIKSFETTRKTKDDARTALMDSAAAEGVTLNEEQTKEYDDLSADITSIDAHLTRLRDLEQSNAAAAQPVVDITKKAHPVITVKANVEPGIAFARYAKALAFARGSRLEAALYAERWKDSTPEVALALKAVQGPASTISTAWAGALVPPVTQLGSEFMELLRPATIVGKIPGLRRVPFNVQVPVQTGGGSYKWVGQGAPKPVTQMTFGTKAVGMSKIAGIVVFTEELARTSDPNAETVFRDDMIRGIATFMDQQFIDPTVAAVAGVSPASITNGIAGTPATADAAADLSALIGQFVAANIPLSSVTLIMSEQNAFNLSLQRTSTGAPLYPNVGPSGGTVLGLNVVTSSTAGGNVIGLAPTYVLFADDGAVTIDVSREASIQMDSAPASPPDATTVFTSLWQENLIGLRAERYCSWTRAYDPAVHYLTTAAWGPKPSAAAAEAAAPNATEHKRGH